MRVTISTAPRRSRSLEARDVAPMSRTRSRGAMLLLALVLASLLSTRASSDEPPRFASELVFPIDPKLHNHAPSIIERPDGGLLVSWYRGSGERKADDVRILGAVKGPGDERFGVPFVLADTPGFPDGNTAMFINRRGQLFLFWPVVLANTWESCLTNYRVAETFDDIGRPHWSWQGALYLRPRDFESTLSERLEERLRSTPTESHPEPELLEALRERIADRLSQRLGWQPRCKPTVLPSGRIVLPLYSDTYSVSIMALSDDDGATWRASAPLAGFGNIQPSVLRRKDGTLVAYMRENGPLDRVRVSESRDDGETWGPVGVTDLPNSGSGLDAIVLRSGAWLIVYNDTVHGRSSLAVSLSDDEGETWTVTRHLERRTTGSFHYPAVIQGHGDTIHVVYSYFVADGKSIRHAAFNESWVRAGDG